MKNNVEKPLIFKIMKIIGCIGILVLIIGIINAVNAHDDWWYGEGSMDSFTGAMITAFIGGVMTMIGFSVGFIPEMEKLEVKTKKYVQSETKEDLYDMANTSADIHKDAATTVARAVKEGLDDEIYCRFCGAKIKKDSVFCSYCGKQLK